MPGEIVTAAQILAGTGMVGWLADKLLTPSADALGEQIKVFASDNLHKIFARASQKAVGDEIHPLNPGFAYQFIQKASFSEDDEFIRDAWANLLLEASKNFEPRHSLMADILSQLNAEDAHRLDAIVPQDYRLEIPAVVPVNIGTSLRIQVERVVGKFPRSLPETQNIFWKLNNESFYWPSVITNVHLPYVEQDSGHTKWFGGGQGVSTSQNVLMRQGLLERFDLHLTIDSSAPNIEGLMITGLGLEFMAICRGVGQ